MAFMNLDLATGRVIERGLKSSSNIKHDGRLKTQYRVSVNGDSDTVEQMESSPIVEYVTGPLCILEAGDENGSDTGTYKYNVFKMWFDTAGIKYEVVEKSNILLALEEAETFISTYGFDTNAMNAKKPT